MKLVHTKHPLPREFRWHPNMRRLAHEADLRITPGAKLCAKLLVFHDQRGLLRFWKFALDYQLDEDCHGAVNSLCYQVIDIKPGQPERSRLVVDPRYFCVIGLVKRRLSMEVICHEAVHAAYAFAKRGARAPWDKHAKDFDEEGIAYPAGIIARRINAALWDAGLFTAANTLHRA